MKEEIITVVKFFIYANIALACLFFWFHAPLIFGLVK